MDRRDLLKTLAACGVAGAALGMNVPAPAGAAQTWWTPTPEMDAMTAMHTRRSVRKFSDAPVPENLIPRILAAGMSAPSGRNKQSWHFVVVREPETLKNLPGNMAGKAPLAVVTCGEHADDLWVMSLSACTQNILLAAHSLGLGAVWTGVHPHESRTASFRRILELPADITPLACVWMGYAASVPAPENRFKPERIYYDRWGGKKG